MFCICRRNTTKSVSELQLQEVAEGEVQMESYEEENVKRKF